MLNRRVVGGSVALVFALLVACTPPGVVSQQRPTVNNPTYSGTDRPTADRPPQTDTACAAWRWIGIKREASGQCPVPPQGDWYVHELFDIRKGAPVPPGLRAFCVYERRDMAGGSGLREVKGLISIEPDCAGLAVAGEVVPESWTVWQKHFFAQVESVPLPAAKQRQVRLSILDTAATRDETGSDHPADHPGNSPHGYTLANMARDLVDPVTRIHTELALPIVAFDAQDPAASKRDEVHGGYVGLLTDLATAVFATVADWQQQDRDAHLVINLSMGWDADFFGGLERDVSTMPPAVQAVYRSLQYAALRGALVVAASGNVLGLPSKDVGPLLPGAWETRPAPSRKECETILGKSRLCQRLDWDRSNPRPLLWAAGGVRGSGKPLANARAKGLPRLVTFADHAVVADQTGTKPTATLTGSSVASLVVSSVASAVWFYNPKASAAEVMEMVYASGQDQGVAADFRLAGSSPNRHRISLCPALTVACKGGACAAPSCDSKLLAVPALPAATMGAPASASAAGVAQAYPNPSPPCTSGYGLLIDTSKPPLHPCPFQVLTGIAAVSWNGPQPGSNPCPNCTMFPDPLEQSLTTRSLQAPAANSYSLRIAVDPKFSGTLTSPILQVENEKPLALPLDALHAGDEVEVRGLPAPPPDAMVFLTFQVDGSEAAFSPVLMADSP